MAYDILVFVMFLRVELKQLHTEKNKQTNKRLQDQSPLPCATSPTTWCQRPWQWDHLLLGIKCLPIENPPCTVNKKNQGNLTDGNACQYIVHAFFSHGHVFRHSHLLDYPFGVFGKMFQVQQCFTHHSATSSTSSATSATLTQYSNQPPQ